MRRRAGGWAMIGLAASGAGCTEQYQQHTQDAAASVVAADAAADAAPDAGGARLMGVDQTIRDAFDGRGASLGPVTSLEGEGNINWPRGMHEFVNIDGRMVLIGSGVQPGARWAVPVLRFVPHEDGTASDRRVTWLPLGTGTYRPTEVSSGAVDGTVAVCSRDHWSAEAPNDRAAVCGTLQMPQGTPSFARQIGPGAGLGIKVRGAGSGRFATLMTSLSPTSQWSIRRWTADLSEVPGAPVTRGLRCPSSVSGFRLRGDDAWVFTQGRGPEECPGWNSVIRVDGVDLRSGNNVFEPYEINFNVAEGAPDAGRTVNGETFVTAVDPEDGLSAVATRGIADPPNPTRAIFFLRLYRDGTWGARKIAEDADAQWMHARPDGGWIVSVMRVDPATMDNVSELLFIDRNGRRQAPPIEYSRGHQVSDSGYGLEPSGRGLWIVDTARSANDTEHGFMRLRRIALRPPTR